MALVDIEKQPSHSVFGDVIHKVSRRPRRDFVAVAIIFFCLFAFLTSTQTLYAKEYVQVWSPAVARNALSLHNVYLLQLLNHFKSHPST